MARPDPFIPILEAEAKLRSSTVDRLIEVLPGTQKITDDHREYMDKATRDAAEKEQAILRRAGILPQAAGGGEVKSRPSLQSQYIAPAGVSSVGFKPGSTPLEWHRTPVDTSARLLRSYLLSAEPAFCAETPGYQAQRVGTLHSEAPLCREMGPVAPVQGLMHGRYHLASRYAQDTKNLSVGRNPVGPMMNTWRPMGH